MEEVRQKAKQNLGRTVSRQLKNLETIQKRTAEILTTKDFSKTSLKVLSEAYHSALQEQWKMFERIGVVGENSAEGNESEETVIYLPEKDKKK